MTLLYSSSGCNKCFKISICRGSYRQRRLEAQEHETRARRRGEYQKIQGPIDPDEANGWIDQHRGHYSDADLGNIELQKQLLRLLRKKKSEAWFAENVRQWRRDWMTWWDPERDC
jgi:hypothetical protein